MSHSFRKINYSLRAAKSVERKMISFALKKLSHFSSLSKYQYIGFGSTTFHDFVLFHKDLGIQKMISIEQSQNQQRFVFNKPFECVELKFGNSTSILPSLDWSLKSILWLDYDNTINKDYLDDITTFFSSATSGSTFLITINCDPLIYGEDNETRRTKIKQDVGEENLFFGNKTIDFSSNSLINSIAKIINNRIKNVLLNRNAAISDDLKLHYEQLFFFDYADGSKMMTIGGLLLDNEANDIFKSNLFDEFTFIQKDDTPFKIEVPITLTLKEIRFLNSLLPNGIDNEGNIVNKDISKSKDLNPDLPPSDIKKFSKIYSFFPLYTEAFSL